MFKSGFVTIVGRPNVGKSTLLNEIMGEKLSIVSNKPQTTRNNIQTILTGDEYQIVFVDTPGIHKPKHKLGEYMVNSAKDSIKEVDLVLFLINPDEEIGAMPEGPKYYPDDMITDVQERFVVSEIIREKALRTLREEIPHGIAVDIIQMKQSPSGTWHIEVDMLCEKDSHKGIIIGKNGQCLKKIGETARYEIERFLHAKVNLKIWVKVRKEWRDNQNLLKELGYKKVKN